MSKYSTGSRTPRLAHLTGPYKPLILFAVYALLLLTLSRLSLGLWQEARVSSAIAWSTYLLQGMRADLILVGLWLFLPVLLAPLWATTPFRRSWLLFCYGWSLLGLILFIFMELATPTFIAQYDIRPNRLFIEYLKYPKEVFSTLWNGFRFSLLIGVFVTLLLSSLAIRLLKVQENALGNWSNTLLWLTWPLVMLLVFSSIRSTSDHRAANPAFFALTGDALVNSLIINSSYSVIYAIYSLKHEAHSSEVYGKLPRSEVIALARDWPWLKNAAFVDSNYPTLHAQVSSVQRTKPLNLVIVLEESMGATFVKSLGGMGVTPELEVLKNEGWWFEQLYATGTRSVRGIEAVISGFMPTPAQSVVKLSLAQQNFFTLGSALEQQGYHTQFIYGGEAHFDNMAGFFTANGFDEIIDLEDMVEPVFVGSWGASDEDLFTTAHRQLTRLSQQKAEQGKAFFTLIFTSSNHSPFEFPDGRIALHEQPKSTVNNAVKYADYALGEFIAQAKASEYWQDTLFLIVADHDDRVYGDNLVPVEKFHIPALILGADIQPKKIAAVASQIDLAPTLLSLLGISSTHPMLGRDFTRDSDSPGRAMMQFEDYYALMEQEQVTILKPDQTAVAARYDRETKKLTLNDNLPEPAQVKRALANVLLPSILYREKAYPGTVIPPIQTVDINVKP